MTNTPTVTTVATNTNNYNNFKNWQDNNQKLDAMDAQCRDMEVVLDAQYRAGASKESIFGSELGQQYLAMNEQFSALAEQTPLDFNFMQDAQGKSYEEQIEIFAQEEIEAKDLNNDGKLDYREFALAEAADLGENATERDIQYALSDAYFLFDSIDSQSQNEEGNGEISLDDLKYFYEQMDGFQNCEQTNIKDGIVDHYNMQDFVLTEIYESQDAINGNYDIDTLMSVYEEIISG